MSECIKFFKFQFIQQIFQKEFKNSKYILIIRNKSYSRTTKTTMTMIL